MATVSDDIVIRLQAELTNFNKNMNQGAAGVQRLEKQVQTSGAKIKAAITNLLSGAAVIALGAAFLRMGANAERAAIDLKKLGDATGVSIGALQEWRHAATQTGAQVTDLDQSVLDLTKAIGEARNGSAEMAKTFRALGLQGLIESGASVETIFLAVADALKAIDDPAQANAIAIKILGENSKQTMGLMREGSGAIREYGRELDRIGGKISTETNKQMVQLAKETAKLEAQYTALATGAWSAFQKIIVGLGLLVQKTKEGVEYLNLQGTGPLSHMARGAHLRSQQKGMFGEQSPDDMLGGFRASYMSRPTPKVDLGNEDTRDAAADAIKRLREENEKYVDQLKFERDIMNLSAVDQEVQIALRNLNAQATDQQVTAIEAYTREMFENAELQKQIAELEQFATGIREQFGDGTAIAAAMQEKLNAALAQGLINMSEYTEALEDLTKDPRIKDLEQRWQEIGNQIEGAFADTFVDIVSGAADAGEALKQLGAQVLDLIAKQLMLQAIQQATGMIFGSGGTGGALAQLFARAGGGPVNRGQPYLVGEQGPELFVPNASGGITPNSRLGSSGGGVNFSPVYNIAPGVNAHEVRMMLHQHDRELLPRFLNAVDDKVRRGTKFLQRR